MFDEDIDRVSTRLEDLFFGVEKETSSELAMFQTLDITLLTIPCFFLVEIFGNPVSRKCESKYSVSWRVAKNYFF